MSRRQKRTITPLSTMALWIQATPNLCQPRSMMLSKHPPPPTSYRLWIHSMWVPGRESLSNGPTVQWRRGNALCSISHFRIAAFHSSLIVSSKFSSLPLRRFIHEHVSELCWHCCDLYLSLVVLVSVRSYTFCNGYGIVSTFYRWLCANASSVHGNKVANTEDRQRMNRHILRWIIGDRTRCLWTKGYHGYRTRSPDNTTKVISLRVLLLLPLPLCRCR